MKHSFSLEYIRQDDRSFTRIKNETEFDCMIKINPIAPKRKFTDIYLVKKGTSLMFEGFLVLPEISIFFEDE